MCGLGDLATSPKASRSYLHENEFGAQGSHIWKLLPEAQHHPAVGEPTLVVVEVLQLWEDMGGQGLLSHLSLHRPPRPPSQHPFSQKPSRFLRPSGWRHVTLAPGCDGERSRELWEHSGGFPHSPAGSLTDFRHPGLLEGTHTHQGPNYMPHDKKSWCAAVLCVGVVPRLGVYRGSADQTPGAWPACKF